MCAEEDGIAGVDDDEVGGGGSCVGTRRMAEVVFPNDGVDGSSQRMLVAVGPEGG